MDNVCIVMLFLLCDIQPCVLDCRDVFRVAPDIEVEQTELPAQLSLPPQNPGAGGTCPGSPDSAYVYSGMSADFYDQLGWMCESRQILVTATPNVGYYDFDVNIAAPNGFVLLHIKATTTTIIRNAYNGAWGDEERTIASYPYKGGVQYKLLIEYTNGKFEVSVNGVKMFDFVDRKIAPLEAANRIAIAGGQLVTDIKVGFNLV